MQKTSSVPQVQTPARVQVSHFMDVCQRAQEPNLANSSVCKYPLALVMELLWRPRRGGWTPFASSSTVALRLRTESRFGSSFIIASNRLGLSDWSACPCPLRPTPSGNRRITKSLTALNLPATTALQCLRTLTTVILPMASRSRHRTF